MYVMITGASGGLGRAMAVECARRGYHLFLTDLDQARLSSIREGLERRFGSIVTARACDLTNPESVDGMLRVIDESGIRFDLLLNIAGMDAEGGFMKREREEIVQIVALNDAATLRITHAVFARRRENKRFTAVFVSSLASMFPMPLKATYAASKRFLLDFATALRQEIKGENAGVLVLCPGGMVTTDENVKAISAQGFWGCATTNGLETVAGRTLDRALSGKAMYVPGVLNRTLSALGKILPRSLVAAIVYRRWSKAQKMWLGTASDAG